MTLSPDANAQHLAQSLSDLEFELLLRYRLQREANKALLLSPELAKSHTAFTFRWKPEGRENAWEVTLGETYSLYSSSKGEVLSKTCEAVCTALSLRKGNKVSALLPAPQREPSSLDEEIPF